MRKMIMTLGTAAAVLALGATAAQASIRPTTPDTTPACGFQCFELSSLVLGTHMIQNAYIDRDSGVGGRIGAKINLKFQSNSHPNEDFTGAKVGTLGSYCGGLIPGESYVCVNYPASYPVFESNWSPYGNYSGLCAGLGRHRLNGANVTLQPCGSSAATIWVGDLADATTQRGHLYTPWVNGADPNFSHPLVLTVDAGTAHPQDELKVERLNLLTGNVVPDSQEFTLRYGPVA
jgi:hypothetical protein